MKRARIEPIPVDAMPVVEILRRDVPRPRQPILANYVEGKALRWRSRKFLGCLACAMGLHPLSTSETPYTAEEFAGGEVSARAVVEFGRWWDRQESKRAMSLVWPRRRRGQSREAVNP